MKAAVLKEGDVIVVMSLEYDICAQGSTESEAIERFQKTVLYTQLLNRSRERLPFEGIPPSPAFYNRFPDKRDIDVRLLANDEKVTVLDTT